jgi:mono/diheme cytochrome c family protein/rhodanese-related sulfurtransferase
MYRHPALVSALVLAGLVAGGSLECRPRAQVPLASAATAKHGEELYARMCAVCHGAAGEGYRADQAPALAHPDFLASVSDVHLRAAIADGRSGSTMSAWSTGRGGPLAEPDVRAVVAFMRSRQEAPPAALDERTVAGDTERGAAIFQRECARCHGAKGTGGPNESIGEAGLLATASNGFLRYAIVKGRSPTAMPSFAQALGDSGVDDVITLLRSWQASAPPPARLPPAKQPPLPLGPVPLNPKGPEPVGFKATPQSTPAEVIKAELDKGARMGFLDARAPSDYTFEHIAGAVSVPFYDPDPYIPALPKNAWLVCYCACPSAESGQLAQKLVAHGFTKVTVLSEGIGFWRGKKWPTTKGTEP